MRPRTAWSWIAPIGVRWSWYYYGRPCVPENLFVEEHWLDRETVRASSTANWRTPRIRPLLDQPAVDFF